MSRSLRALAFVAPIALIVISGFGVARANAFQATPVAEGTGASLILIEHADRVTEVDLGETRPSIGDMIVWGPNALYDETNVSDTGAVTQGSCIAFDDSSNCVGTETIVFADGSTLHFQGVERGGGVSSMRTFVGGSGRYLGATGTMAVKPSADLTLWTKTIAFAEPME
jgi:hypothetical protein